jgi:PAS domain S-box-containing protein
MNSQPDRGFWVPGATAVVITGGTAAERDELRRRLEAAGMSLPITTGADTNAPQGSEPVITAGVIRISSDGDASDSTDAEESDPRSVTGGSNLGSDPPVVVVGSDVDIAAAYEAGATLSIPLAVSNLPDAAIDRIADQFRRVGVGEVGVDLLEDAPVGATVVDPESETVIGYTSKCAAMVGHDRSADAFELSDLTSSGDLTEPEVSELIREAAAGGEATVELHDVPAESPADCLEVTFEPAALGGEQFVVGWLTDITDRIERTEELERYETILESLDDAVYAMSSSGAIEYVNDKYVSMKGVDREELIGTDLYEWAGEEVAERAKEIRRQMEAGEIEVGRLEYEFQSADGETTPAEIRFVEMSGDGEASGGAGVIRDISEQKSYERRLERQNERLEEFASVVSHDLRNPLSVASGRLELAMEECDSDHLDAVADAHDRMADLIDNLLVLAREGDDVQEIEPVDLASLVENCWANVETGGATIEVSVDRPIRADSGRLQQIVENLIRNAVEHGSTGSRSGPHGNSVEHGSTGSRTESDDTVEHSATNSRSENHGDSVEHAGDDVSITVGSLDDGFYVEDDGPGIPPEDRDNVFEAGYSTDPEGTGFGLSIVKQVAEAHGWTVRLTDAAGGGARFEFTGVAFADE